MAPHARCCCCSLSLSAEHRGEDNENGGVAVDDDGNGVDCEEVAGDRVDDNATSACLLVAAAGFAPMLQRVIVAGGWAPVDRRDTCTCKYRTTCAGASLNKLWWLGA